MFEKIVHYVKIETPTDFLVIAVFVTKIAELHFKDKNYNTTLAVHMELSKLSKIKRDTWKSHLYINASIGLQFESDYSVSSSDI